MDETQIALKAFHDDLASLEQAVRFILDSTIVRMTVPSAVLDQNGNLAARVISGPLTFFYEKAIKNGKAKLQDLVLSDFQAEIAECGGVGEDAQGHSAIVGG